ncbi:OLC1v1000676C1 [Oldenlandia corymbosa var. corymbosa]|uniref:OLC1v1000676C1 n=1 Tax=Oldenlandia corymbosa var. corymbosa TaxID=529605 RepID=A0AAV1D4Z6_OLDCO|nr:OLC1v1000676C1 [Oldenlandia corymbosa var. corymbosa]
MESLEPLVLEEDCINLGCLPSVRLMNLKNLRVLFCPLLEQNCTETTGAEWPKIQHIRAIYLASRTRKLKHHQIESNMMRTQTSGEIQEAEVALQLGSTAELEAESEGESVQEFDNTEE